MNDENIYDEDYIAKRKREMIPDGGFVRVPIQLMDSAPASDTRSEAVRLRDEAHRLMIDRMTTPKAFDPITGKRLVNDGVVDDLSDREIFKLAKRLSGPLCLGVPENWSGSPNEAEEDQGPERQDRDNRRAHFPKPVRDRAEAVRLRDESYALMLDRMKNPRNYDKDGRRI